MRNLNTWLGREKELEARMEEIGREYAVAREQGDFDVAGVIAGESCALIHDIPPAGEIVSALSQRLSVCWGRTGAVLTAGG